jgi:hypothetical protein
MKDQAGCQERVVKDTQEGQDVCISMRIRQSWPYRWELFDPLFSHMLLYNFKIVTWGQRVGVNCHRHGCFVQGHCSFCKVVGHQCCLSLVICQACPYYLPWDWLPVSVHGTLGSYLPSTDWEDSGYVRWTSLQLEPTAWSLSLNSSQLLLCEELRGTFSQITELRAVMTLPMCLRPEQTLFPDDKVSSWSPRWTLVRGTHCYY